MVKCNLKILMADRLKTLNDLSQETGINKDTLCNIKNSKAPAIRMDVLDKLCEYFDCTPGDLFDIIPTEHQNIEKKRDHP